MKGPISTLTQESCACGAQKGQDRQNLFQNQGARVPRASWIRPLICFFMSSTKAFSYSKGTQRRTTRKESLMPFEWPEHGEMIGIQSERPFVLEKTGKNHWHSE